MKNPSPIFSNQEIENIGRLYKKLPKVSFLYVTRNRCPYKAPWKNPLVWSFLTLEASRIKKIDEFIVIDDASNDFTKESIKWLQKMISSPIRYYRNKERKGCSLSRKIGIKRLKTEIFFMGDDDCLYKPDFVVGSIIAFIPLMRKYKNKLSVLALPIYDREISYTETISSEEIGKTLYHKTWFYHNFDKFPKEYEETPRYIDENDLIYKPIEVETFTGVTLSSKKSILAVGSFMDLSMWETDYSEHLELAYKLKRNKYRIFFLPDPRISCTHIKYGVFSLYDSYKKFNDTFFPGVGLSLGDILKESTIEREDTGSRVKSEDFHVCEIGSFFSFYLKMSLDLAKKHAVKEYKNFVEKNLIFSSTPQKIRSKKKRRRIWEKAVKKGISVTEKQTGKTYKNLYREILERI